MSVRSALRISHAPVPAFMTLGLFWGSFAALAPVLKAQIGADDATYGLLLLGTSLGLITTMFVAPTFDRRLGALSMPVAGCLLALAFLTPALAQTPSAFFVAMVAVGLGSGLTDVVMNARVSELEARHGRPLMNANHGMFSAAYMIGALVTGFAREAGFAPVTIFAGFGLVALFLSTRMRMEVSVSPASEGRGARFPYGIVALCGGVVLLAFMAEAAVESWSALHVERTLGGRAAEGALGPAMLGLAMAVGRFSGQQLAERFNDLSVIFWATLLAAAGALIAATAVNPLMAYLGFGTVGLGVSVIGPLGLALVGRMVPEEVRLKAISRAAVIGFTGFFLAPASMGLISQVAGLRVAFASIAFLVLMLLPLLALLRRQGR
ncbi:MAG: MFS transporter [Litoreibacter sp.]|nr:MFS transporter [Litoreibacter sp.]